MIKHWDIVDIYNQISAIARAESDPRMDGFNTWGCKQDLYQLKWFIEDKLDKCSTYAGEDEFVRKREKQQTINAIKGV